MLLGADLGVRVIRMDAEHRPLLRREAICGFPFRNSNRNFLERLMGLLRVNIAFIGD